MGFGCFFFQRINRLQAQAGELSLLRRTAYLGFLVLDCEKVNLILANRAKDLALHLTSFLIDRNRELNKK